MAPRKALQNKMDEAMRHHRRKDLGRAEGLYRQVLARDADHLVAIHLLSALLLEQGHIAKAIELIRSGIARAPEQAVFFANLGEAQRRSGDHASAVASLNRAIALEPALAEAHHALGMTHHAEGGLDEAIRCYRRAAALKPSALLYKNLAGALHERGDLDEAVDACTRALDIDGQSADALNELGLVLKELGRVDEAVQSFRRALTCQPDHCVAHGNLVYALGFLPEESARSIESEASRWSARHVGTPGPVISPHANDRDPERRLRIGYLSPDFRNHCHTLFLIPLIEHHDRAVVEVFCYSLVSRPDDFTDRIRGLSDHFRDVVRLGDAEAEHLIRRDQVDVLVDVTMHLPGNRLKLLARKPAPVQVAWLAYPGTTGLEAIDYRITDVFLDPPDRDVTDWYSEQSVRLPETFWCYHPLTREPAVGPSPAARDGRITFGCLSNCSKHNDAVFALWSRVMRAVDGSRLILLGRSAESRRRVSETFARQGVDATRLEFVDYQPRDAYLRLYQRIDVCLDTFPHNGGTTSLDALWMGVPVVTLVGPTAVGRAGLCYASNLGMTDLVARTPDEFVEAAVRLTSDARHLAQLRAGLRGRLEASPLMDAPRFARHIEAAYRQMWRRWCA